ncbi:hypothetical protein QLH51_14945 [Sphingomonas sp. 2R-10]|uniref:hypothetical protein n=1 Tax=Sphingomonas sp. 2R-10 TaxID=3045148 RepID=UPI000F79AEDE|nr:hypothetical protein [Sphingomonas sp. 2R-10]MDJ0278093.1 hypothetical protein [Sphingomonas sp. 2R-10]
MQNDSERTLALAYAPDDGRRAALAALLMLDAALGEVVASTTQPALGQIRLAWWREQLVKLDTHAPPAMSELVTLADRVLPRGVRGTELAEMVAGWDVLIEEEALDDVALGRFAAERGGRLFTLAARVLGGEPMRAERPGRGWALADLSHRVEDATARGRAEAMARDALAGPLTGVAKPLGLMALSARMDLAGVPAGGPKRAARLLWFGLAGR